MPESPTKIAPDLKWQHPSEVMKFHKLKKKQKALQARIRRNEICSTTSTKFEEILSAGKRKNPFLRNEDFKRSKIESNVLEESTDQTIFKLLNNEHTTQENHITSFSNVLGPHIESTTSIELVKAQEEKWLPIDWSLKTKMRFLSLKPFLWNHKLKISEEASGVTAFTRCLDSSTETTLDISPNAKFYQCCLIWQQPSLPWLTLFPRNNTAHVTSNKIASNSAMKESLQKSWSDSLRSLFQLLRTGQCPYFYACANSFTVLFRAAGICGFSDVHAIITPTTRGFRNLLNQEEIEYTMPLKTTGDCDQNYDTSNLVVEEDNDLEPSDENWLKSLGVNEDEIKQISYTQGRIQHKAERQVDNSEQSTILVEGIEVHALYNFLINCKSATSLTGPFADIPPTLLSPVAFHGAALNSLKILESKVHTDDADYYSLELSGPILPTVLHNLFEISPPEHNLTVTFKTTKTTEPFSKLKTTERKSDLVNKGAVVFRKENLSDCGLFPKVLKHFCLPENKFVTNVECLKYISENRSYTWT